MNRQNYDPHQKENSQRKLRNEKKELLQILLQITDITNTISMEKDLKGK